MALVDSIDFAAWPQPEWNRSTTVRDTLRKIEAVGDQAAAKKAYDALLYALGNNHAGTYYPVVLAVLPCLADLLRTGGEWTQQVVLEALIDLHSSFGPEPGFERHASAPGRPADSVVDMLRSRIAALSNDIEAIANGSNVASGSAAALLNDIRN